MTSLLDFALTSPMPKSASLTRPQSGPRNDAPERVVLTGFMGSGKSTVGRLLAAELGWEFLDLDDVIEQRTGMTVPQIFSQRGEAGFRKEETAALASALRHSPAVIALGGGAPETLSNRLFLEQTPATMVVYLAAPFAVLERRCSAQKADPAQPVRPVFSDVTAAQARFESRQPLYRRLARVTVETSGQSPEETVAAVTAAVVSGNAHV